MNEKKPKSQSQKIRNILYRLWQKDPEGMSEMEYYQKKTGVIINDLLKKLDDAPLPEDDL